MNTSVTRLFLVLMLASGWTWAQTASSDGVRESTDPSRAADVERKAQTMSGQKLGHRGKKSNRSKRRKNRKS
jgi:Ni/Co efflux regulator RcnB